MANITLEQKDIITLHFKVPEHAIPLKQFVNSAQAIQSIIDDFNEQIFDKSIKYKLRVIPPEKGGLVELIQFVLDSDPILTGAGVWAFLHTGMGKAYVKAATGYEPIYFAAMLGQATRDLFIKKLSNGTATKDVSKNKIIAALITVIIVQMVIGFLKNEPSDLEKAGLTKEKHRDAYIAKNTIIQECIDNPEVTALGFDKSHNFPISHTDFTRHIVTIPDKEELVAVPEWQVDIADVKVHSPNWKRKGNRQWQGDTKTNREISFSMEDEAFWEHVRLKDIQPDINDDIRVQWAYHALTGKKPTNVRVLKVLTYNGKNISSPLNNTMLKEELGGYSEAPPDPQANLFELLADSKTDD